MGSVSLAKGRTRAFCLLALVIALAGCAPGAERATVPWGKDILVGAPVSLTGALAEEGRLTRQGYEMWLHWANETAGGVEVGGERHRFQLVLKDDQSSPEQAAELARGMLAADRVQFLLGPYGSANTLAVAEVAERNRVPLVEGNGAAGAIFNNGYRYVFGVLSPSDRYMAGVIEMAIRLEPRPRSIALLSANDSFSREVAESVKRLAGGSGFEVRSSQEYPAGATDLTVLVEKARRDDPDVLMNSGHLGEALAIHRAAKQLGLNAKIFAYSVGPSVPQFVTELGPDADYVFGGSQWTPQVRYRPAVYLTVREYVATYKRMFRTLDEPSYHVAEATAAGLALQLAIQGAGVLDPRRVRDALARLDVMTFYGRIKFDERGVNIYKPMVVEQIQRGRRHTVFPASVADLGPMYPTPPWSQRSR